VSRRVHLGEAIGEIVSAFARGEADRRHPSDAFFFLIGAGLSTPQVPLAGEIDRHCREVAELDERTLSEDPLERYSEALSRAYPQPVERQEYFRSLIEGKPISRASFRLAHLLATDRVPRLVVTPNFDDFLSRALRLFGREHIVSDHPATAERVDPERRDDIQILHVHGTYWFYDCCNLEGEIDSRAEQEPVHRTVSSRLDRILDRRSPIVLGYSGWERDVFMTALERRLSAGPLPYNLYWFCHRGDAVDRLPGFLRGRTDVCFVVPPEAKHDSDDPRLDAIQVLHELSRTLEIEAPALTRNPIEFYAEHLRASLLVSESPEPVPDHDVYRLEPMIARLSAMAGEWDVEKSDLLEQIRDAVRRSDYRAAVRLMDGLRLDALSAEQLDEICDTGSTAAAVLDDESDEELTAFDLELRAYDALARVDPVAAARRISSAAWAYTLKGGKLELRGDLDAAIEAYELAEEHFGDSSVNHVQAPVIAAVLRRAQLLAERRYVAQALTLYQMLADRWADDPDPDVRDFLEEGLLAWAALLNETGDWVAARPVYDRVVETFGGDEAVGGDADRVAGALTSKGQMLQEAAEHADAIDAFDRVLALFQAGRCSLSRGTGAQSGKIASLLELDRVDDARAEYAGIDERFGGEAAHVRGHVRVEVDRRQLASIVAAD
jgi:tetratricopeptide (TPR) repeat protein